MNRVLGTSVEKNDRLSLLVSISDVMGSNKVEILFFFTFNRTLRDLEGQRFLVKFIEKPFLMKFLLMKLIKKCIIVW